MRAMSDRTTYQRNKGKFTIKHRSGESGSQPWLIIRPFMGFVACIKKHKLFIKSSNYNNVEYWEIYKGMLGKETIKSEKRNHFTRCKSVYDIKDCMYYM